MTRYAIVRDGVAVNVILWEGDTPIQVDGELIAVPDYVGPSWTLVSGAWVSPFVPEPAPTEEVQPSSEV